MFTSLPSLNAPQCQDVLLVGEKLLHLVERLLPPDGQLAPGFGPSQDFADRALGQAQDVVPKHPLPNVVFDQLLLHLPGDFGRVHLLALRDAARPLGAAGGGRRAAGIRAGSGWQGAGGVVWGGKQQGTSRTLLLGIDFKFNLFVTIDRIIS